MDACKPSHSFRPKPTIAITGQETFAVRELLALPRYTIEEYTAWGDYIDILKRFVDDVIDGKYIGSATGGSHPSLHGLLGRWRVRSMGCDG